MESENQSEHTILLVEDLNPLRISPFLDEIMVEPIKITHSRQPWPRDLAERVEVETIDYGHAKRDQRSCYQGSQKELRPRCGR